MKTFVITRDRVSYARRCLASLRRYSDLWPIVIVDHGSTYPPMLNWLEEIKRDGILVDLLGDHGPRALWDRTIPNWILDDERYVVTDCDIELYERMPHDWFDRLHHLLDENPGLVKVGCALRLNDLPNTDLAAKVKLWEQPFWFDHLGQGDVFRAPIDTTFALYRSLREVGEFRLGPAARVAGPWTARHLPWYEDMEETIDVREAMWYREHALPGTSHWLYPEAWK